MITKKTTTEEPEYRIKIFITELCELIFKFRFEKKNQLSLGFVRCLIGCLKRLYFRSSSIFLAAHSITSGHILKREKIREMSLKKQKKNNKEECH